LTALIGLIVDKAVVDDAVATWIVSFLLIIILFDGTVGNSKPSNKFSVLTFVIVFTVVAGGIELLSATDLSAIIMIDKQLENS